MRQFIKKIWSKGEFIIYLTSFRPIYLTSFIRNIFRLIGISRRLDYIYIINKTVWNDSWFWRIEKHLDSGVWSLYKIVVRVGAEACMCDAISLLAPLNTKSRNRLRWCPYITYPNILSVGHVLHKLLIASLSSTSITKTPYSAVMTWLICAIYHSCSIWNMDLTTWGSAATLVRFNGVASVF